MTVFEARVEKEFIKGKRRARKLALQALYQWLMAKTDLYEIETQFHMNNAMEKVDTEYFHQLLHDIPLHLHAIEEAFSPCLDRTIQELNPIELSVLRIGTYELLYRPEIPYKVILDEAITLTKAFGAQDGYRYVNGVLNHLAKQVRVFEIDAEHG